MEFTLLMLNLLPVLAQHVLMLLDVLLIHVMWYIHHHKVQSLINLKSIRMQTKLLFL